MCFDEDDGKEGEVNIGAAQAEERVEKETVTENIVEMDGDVQPSALDALIKMINS